MGRAVTFLVFATFIFLSVTTCLCSHEITDCGGSYITFSGQSLDNNNVTKVPGGSFELSVTAVTQMTIPDGAILMKLIRRVPDNIIVPCLDGISGSCQFDLCDFMTEYPDMIYPPFDCPISSSSYNFEITPTFNEPWLFVNGEMQTVSYTIRHEILIDEELVGCFEFPFTLTTVSIDY